MGLSQWFELITKEFDGIKVIQEWMKFMLTMILINVDNLCWLLMFGGDNKEHEKRTMAGTTRNER